MSFMTEQKEEGVKQPSFLAPVAETQATESDQYQRKMAMMAATVNGDRGDYATDFGNKYEEMYAKKESNERRKAASARINRLSTDVQEAINEGDSTADMLRDSVQYLVDQEQAEKQYALEQEFIHDTERFRDENPAWADMRVLNKDFAAKRAEDNEKDLIIRNALERMSFDIEAEDSFLGDTVDIVTDMATVGIQNLVSFLHAGDWNGGAAEIRRKGHELRQLPVEELPEALEAMRADLTAGSALLKADDERALKHMQAALGKEDMGAITAEALMISLFDAVPVKLGAATKLIPESEALMAARLGAGQRVSDAASRILRTREVPAESAVDSVEEAIELSLPIRVGGTDSVDGLSAGIRADLEANTKALEELKTIAQPDRLDPEELADAMQKTVERHKRLTTNQQITHTDVSYDGTSYSFDIIQGTKAGNPYASEATAKAAQKKAKIGGDVFQSAEGGWYIKHKQVVSESMVDKGFQNLVPVNTAKRWLQAPKAFVDNYTGRQGTAAGAVEARTAGVIKKMYNDHIRKLPSKDFDKVFQIADQGLEEAKWFSPEELANRYRVAHHEPISDAQVKAYMTARQISDFSHFTENHAAYVQANAKGLQTVTLPGVIQESFNGRVITEAKGMTEALGHRVYDATSNTFYQLDQRAYEAIQKRKLVMVRPEDASWTVELLGEGASYIVTGARQAKAAPLKYEQVGYVAGGRVSYKDKFFVGQVRSGKFEDGTRYQLRPKTHRSATTQLEAEKYVNMHNEAFELVKWWKEFGGKKGKRARDRKGEAPITRAEMNKKILAVTGKSLDDYLRFIEVEKFDINTPMHFRKDRQAPKPDFDMREQVMMYDPQSMSSGFGVNKAGRLSARTDSRLKNVAEDDAVQMDFISSLTKSTDSAISAGSYTDFKISSVNRFNTTFRKYFENADRYSPYDIATGKAPIHKETPPEVANQIKAHTAYIKSVLRQPSEWDAAVQNTMDKFAHFVESKTDGTKVAKAGKYVSTKISDIGDPIGRIRGINFDLNLGMFNPAQLFMQANSVLTGLSLSPKHGMAAFKDIPGMRYALITGDSPTAEYLAKATKNPELIEQVEQFKRLGFNDFGANLAMMDSQSTLGATTNRLASNVQRTREAGRFFFQEGERYGRLMAYSIARRKFKELDHTALKMDSNVAGRDADNWIREETDRLLLSPNADNNQLFTKGITALPTQFWSYMGKMTDAVLTGSGGRYTGAERARLIGGQALFYGAAGVPLADWALDKYQKETGATMDETASKFIHNGLIDTMIFTASGGTMDTDFSASSGLGGFVGQMTDNLWENPISTVAFGAAGSKASGAWKMMGDTARMYSLWHNPTVEGVTAVSLAGLQGVFSSMDKVTRGILAYNTGIWFSKHGAALADVSEAEAIASIFGIKPQSEADLFAAFADRKEDREKYVRDVSRSLERLHSQWERANTPAEKEHIQSLINTFSNIHNQSGYFPEVIHEVGKIKRTRTLEEGVERKLNDAYLAGKKVNTTYMSSEAKEEILRGIEE